MIIPSKIKDETDGRVLDFLNSVAVLSRDTVAIHRIAIEED
jgi:hypothetical protein